LPYKNNSSLASVDTGGGNLSKEAVRLVPNATRLLKCPLFTLPLEIRRLIYDHILISEHPIVNPGKLLEGGKIELFASCGSIHVIDAAIVRTCRGIYAETMPMLYEDNAFEFHKASDISRFHAGGLQRFPTGIFGSPFEKAPLLTVDSLYLQERAPRPACFYTQSDPQIL